MAVWLGLLLKTRIYCQKTDSMFYNIWMLVIHLWQIKYKRKYAKHTWLHKSAQVGYAGQKQIGGKKNKHGSFDGESKDVCNMISDLGVTTASQNTPKDSLSMHQSIRQHMQTRNSEPQYSDSSMESLSSDEYDAPYDHMTNLIFNKIPNNLVFYQNLL